MGTDVESNKQGTTEGLGDLMSHSKLCLITCIQIYSWFVNSAAYYGLTLAAGSAGGGLYTATALSGAVEIPAYILTNFLLDYYGRRAILYGCQLCCDIHTQWGDIPNQY